ncbi:MAG: FHA domain-containing protein [Gammaproteobacteria bacterium]|nr:FHA domain-containing protein [Gammaproteobacteria bacterium]
MAEPLILEIISRGRGQPQYRRIEQLPFRIGRGYDNDLILADATVSAAHLQFEQDDAGTVLVRNLSNENGTRLGKRKLGPEAEPLPLSASLQIGHTVLRVLRPDTPVPPAIRPHAVPGALTLFERLPFALLLLVLLFTVNCALTFLHRIGPLTLREALFSQAPQLLAPILLALMTGFIARLLLHHWRFGLQLTIACISFIALALAQELVYRISYYSSSDVVAELSNLLLAATVFTALFAWQLRAFSNLTRRRALGVALAISWPLLALVWIQNEVRTPDFIPQPDMHLVLLASDRRAAETLDLPRFLREIRDELDEGIERELRQDRSAPADAQQPRTP